jgi:hypothetical protein
LWQGYQEALGQVYITLLVLSIESLFICLFYSWQVWSLPSILPCKLVGSYFLCHW